jgi:aryl-alcohol dehydrogenase (NADP+)
MVPMLATTHSQPSTAGTLARPVVSMVLTEPPPPEPSTDQRQPELAGHPLAHVVFSLDGCVRRPAAHREVVAAHDDGAPVHFGPPEHEVGRREALELVLLVVGRPAGDLADLVEGAGVHQLGDPLADRVTSAVVLSPDALGAAELLRELLAPPELIQLRLPVHVRSAPRRFSPEAKGVRGVGRGYTTADVLRTGSTPVWTALSGRGNCRSSMRHVRLGRTGLSVSRLCLGTMTFGLQCDEAASAAILDHAAAGGITFLDTADVYPLGGGLDSVGRTEEILGRWLQGRRHDFVIATKCSGAMSARPWDRGSSRKHVLDAIEGSLRRLRTDYVDLYQLHHPDLETPIDETLRALDDVVRAGKARYVGCSNFRAYQVARALGRSEVLGVARLDSVQPRYNLLFRQVERELLPLCQEEGLGVIPYNPLAGGFLSGKHHRAAGPTAGTRFTLGSAARLYAERYWHEREFATVEALRPLAAEAGMSLTHVAVAWVLAHPAITAPIIGASRPEQLDDVLPAVEKALVADLKARLDELTREYRLGDDPR